MVRVKLHGRGKGSGGEETLYLDTKGQISLEDILRHLAKTEGVPSPKFPIILINGRNCIFLDGLKTQVQDGDLVEILSPVTGG